MKQMKQSQFYCKKINQSQKEVQLNNKYTIKKEDELFETIDFIIEDIEYKNQQQKKQHHQAFQISYYPTLQFKLSKAKMNEEKCMICQEEYQIKQIQKQFGGIYDDDILMLGCSHMYHKICLKQLIGQRKWAKCPICSTIFGRMEGDQPQGTINIKLDKNLKCEGHPKGTYIITYSLKGGQRNGVHFQGTSRTAYLPDTPEGRQVLDLFKQAFERKLIFTVGRSVTTGLDNQTVWNGIHHKTCVSGGVASFGYPDPTYFKRVKEQLAAKGVVGHKK